jgi:hypothetical protein
MMNEEEIEKTSLLMQSQPIYSESYVPIFINDMSEDKVKEFSTILSQKLRHVKLAMSKIKLERNKFEDFKKETERRKTINLQASIEMLNADKKKKKAPKPIFDRFAKKRAEIFGINTRKIRNPFDKFSFFKEDVDKSLGDLEYAIEERINKRYLKPLKVNKVILPKITLAKSENFPNKNKKTIENPKSNNSDNENIIDNIEGNINENTDEKINENKKNN